MKQLHKIGKELVQRIITDMAKGERIASGTGVDSLGYKIEGDSISITGIYYMYYVEHGRKAGKQPPIDSIEDWVLNKGVVFFDREGEMLDARTTAFLIARVIGERGAPSEEVPIGIIQDVIDSYDPYPILDIDEMINMKITQNWK